MTTTFEITENAKKQIAKLLEKEPKGSFFRVSVEGGGCSGFKYNFTIDNKTNDKDLQIQQEAWAVRSFSMPHGLDMAHSMLCLSLSDSFRITSMK